MMELMIKLEQLATSVKNCSHSRVYELRDCFNEYIDLRAQVVRLAPDKIQQMPQGTAELRFKVDCLTSTRKVKDRMRLTDEIKWDLVLLHINRLMGQMK